MIGVSSYVVFSCFSEMVFKEVNVRKGNNKLPILETIPHVDPISDMVSSMKIKIRATI